MSWKNSLLNCPARARDLRRGVGFGYYLVFNIGYVHQVEDTVPFRPKISGNNVICQICSSMSDMAVIVDCGTAHEHVDPVPV